MSKLTVDNIDLVVAKLNNLSLNADKFDISSFKAELTNIAELADSRDPEDRTDFSFMNRRLDDNS